jgi:anti-sigma-K factor RskA
MNNHPSFDHWQELMAGFVLGDLDPSETAEVERLLSEHPELATEVGKMQEVLRQITEDSAETEVPSHLCWEILHTAEGELETTTVTNTRLNYTTKSARRLWYLVAGGIVATAIGVFGWHDYQMQQALQRSQAVVAMLQSPRSRIFQFQGINDAKQASGSMIVNVSENQAALNLRALPIQKGKFYRLWAILDRDRQHRCGEAIPGEQIEMSARFSISPQTFSELYHPQLQGFIVTIEDAPTTTQPSDRVIMSSI